MSAFSLSENRTYGANNVSGVLNELLSFSAELAYVKWSTLFDIFECFLNLKRVREDQLNMKYALEH